MSPFQDVDECAAYLKISPQTLYKWAHLGKIPYRKHLGRLVFHMDEIDKWSAAQARPVRTSSQTRFESARERLRSLKTEHTPAVLPNSQKGAG